jgi:signal transduction histidine kinase
MRRELHDSVAQTLYAIALGAARALSLARRTPAREVEHALNELLQLADIGQSELRAALTNLHSDPTWSASLGSGLTNLARTVGACSDLDLRFLLADEPNLPATVTNALVMIGREALRNAVKHAGATRVDVVLMVEPKETVLLITDNGRGFDSIPTQPGHFGLHYMEERAAAIGATLQVISSIGAGTQVSVRVPHAAQHDVWLARD